MKQTLQKGKPLDQPVPNLHDDFVSIVSIVLINLDPTSAVILY